MTGRNSRPELADNAGQNWQTGLAGPAGQNWQRAQPRTSRQNLQYVPTRTGRQYKPKLADRQHWQELPARTGRSTDIALHLGANSLSSRPGTPLNGALPSDTVAMWCSDATMNSQRHHASATSFTQYTRSYARTVFEELRIGKVCTRALPGPRGSTISVAQKLCALRAAMCVCVRRGSLGVRTHVYHYTPARNPAQCTSGVMTCCPKSENWHGERQPH